MKSYPSIPGLKNIPWGEDCIAFYKYDGSNLRFEWNKKQGWYKFGTRRRLFDETDIEYGRSIELFKNKHAEGIEKVLREKYKSFDNAIVFCEFFGDESFAGWHNFEKPFELKIIEIGIHKKGFILPEDFVKNFGHLNISDVIYKGRLDQNFVNSVKNGVYNLKEGVVVKGSLSGKNPNHSYWMAKIKTNWWFDELKRRASQFEHFRQILIENEEEQKCLI